MWCKLYSDSGQLSTIFLALPLKGNAMVFGSWEDEFVKPVSTGSTRYGIWKGKFLVTFVVVDV